jgi:hypothetical protein
VTVLAQDRALARSRMAQPRQSRPARRMALGALIRADGDGGDRCGEGIAGQGAAATARLADTFTQRFQVRFDECALNGSARASAILRYVVETAFGTPRRLATRCHGTSPMASSG